MKRLLFSILFIGSICWGQDGSLDETFGNSGWVLHDLGEGMETFSDVAENSSNQLFVLGSYDDFQGGYESFILSFEENGSLNTAFGNGGLLFSEEQSFPNSVIRIQSDDKLLIQGNGPNNNPIIVRLLTDGTIDASFGVDGVLDNFGTNSSQLKFESLEDGKLLSVTTGIYSDIPHLVLRRFTNDGQLDTGYGIDGESKIPIAEASSVSLSTLNKIEEGAIIFYRKTINGNDFYELVKIHENGGLNTSFGINGFAEVILDENETNCKSLVFNDQSILVSCAYWDWQSELFLRSMQKLLPSGVKDSSFNENATNGYSGVIIQPNQRIISDSSTSDWEGGLMPYFGRFYSDGFADYSFQFSTGGTGSVGFMNLILLNSGKLLFVASDVWYNHPDIEIILIRLNNNPLDVPDFETQEITVFPNPSDGLFQLKLKSFNQDLEYSMTDISGKQIQTGTLTGQNATLDLSMFEAGMYFLNLGDKTLKLIKN